MDPMAIAAIRTTVAGGAGRAVGVWIWALANASAPDMGA
jgi:hypothetical protein